MTDGPTDRSKDELLEEVRAMKKELQALRSEVKGGGSRPDPSDAREAQAQAEEDGDLRRQGEAKAMRAMNADTPNGRTEGGWL